MQIDGGKEWNFPYCDETSHRSQREGKYINIIINVVQTELLEHFPLPTISTRSLKSLDEYEITAHPKIHQSHSIYSALVHLIPFVRIIEREKVLRTICEEAHGKDSPRSYSLSCLWERNEKLCLQHPQLVFVFLPLA